MISKDMPNPPSDAAGRADWARGLTRTRVRPHAVHSETFDDGTILLTSNVDLPEPAWNTGDWLHRWAEEAPDRIALAERWPDGAAGWREVSYADLLAQVRAVSAALLARGLGKDDCIAILSGNGIDHLILTLAGQYVGIPTVPLAEQYSLIPEAHARLVYVLNKVKPALAFVDDATRYAAALALPELAEVEIVASRGDAGRATTAFADLLATEADDAVDDAHDEVGPDSLAKILFTSGSTSNPKGVLTTHRMLTVNQAQLAASLPFLQERPPVVTDWLPWNHVFGGSHNVNMVLANGGTLNIDGGKPAGPLFETTLANRTDRPGTILFNVPVGFDNLVRALADKPDERRAMFAETDMIFYAGATLAQDTWEALERYCIEASGGLPLMISSWGLTETAPATLIVHEPIGRAGVIGVPVPGVTVKLIPTEDAGRYEIRVKGPNIMPAYHEDADKTAAAFDEDLFFITGDAVRFVDPADPSRGLAFDGRVSEDFKLSTGTWVQAGTLRLAVLAALKGLAADAVICGHDRTELGVMIFPLPGAGAGSADAGALTDPALKAEIAARLKAYNAGTSGSAKRIARALVLASPPSIEGAEITDKGSLNVRRILENRADVLERLYDDADPATITA